MVCSSFLRKQTREGIKEKILVISMYTHFPGRQGLLYFQGFLSKERRFSILQVKIVVDYKTRHKMGKTF